MSSPLHLVRLAIDQRRLFSLAATLGLTGHQTELHYLVHTAMARLFGESMPKPFHAEMDSSAPQRSHVPIWGYTPHDAEALRHQAEAFGSPEAWRCCDWQTLASKPMPTAWQAGQRLGFSARCCPVRRVGRGTAHHRGGAEVDAFLLECGRQGSAVAVDRQAVYRGWFEEHLQRTGAARLCHLNLVQFEQPMLTRRTQGSERQVRWLRKPAATLRGELQVDDPEAFAVLLERGIGRHRAFGFGMLLLRPPQEKAC